MSTLNERFFETSRGRLVMLLRGPARTVNELAERLGLTDNAVRAHLLSLERDGLVRQSGTQPGTRKPHFRYELTEEAEQLFPKAYDALLNRLIAALKGRLTPDALEKVLREVGRSLAEAQVLPPGTGSLESRLDNAIVALETIGGAARTDNTKEGVVISSDRCPLSAAVAEHPEVCKVAETLLAEIIGTEVREHCDRNGRPRCRFEVAN